MKCFYGLSFSLSEINYVSVAPLSGWLDNVPSAAIKALFVTTEGAASAAQNDTVSSYILLQ